MKQLALLARKRGVFQYGTNHDLLRSGTERVNITIGKMLFITHQDCPGLMWNQDEQPYGFAGVRLFEAFGGGGWMRGLRKYLTPFAPDQSGAVSVLFELGGIVVICDAGDVLVMSVALMSRDGFEQKSDFRCRTSRYGCNSRA